MAKWPDEAKTMTVRQLRSVKCACGHDLTFHIFTRGETVGACTSHKRYRDPNVIQQKCTCVDFTHEPK